jgi:hypothetical protein
MRHQKHQFEVLPIRWAEAVLIEAKPSSFRMIERSNAACAMLNVLPVPEPRKERAFRFDARFFLVDFDPLTVKQTSQDRRDWPVSVILACPLMCCLRTLHRSAFAALKSATSM